MRNLLLVFLLCLAAIPGRADEKPIALTTGDHYPPYTGLTLPGGGLTTKLVEEAFARAGIKVRELQWLPWERALQSTKIVSADATFPWFKNEERQADFFYSRPIIKMHHYLFGRAGEEMPDINDLQDRRICTPHGYAAVGPVAEAFAAGTAIRETPHDMATCFLLLRAGRVDFVEANQYDGQYAMNLAGVDQSSVNLSEPHHLATLHLLVSRQHPQGAALLDRFHAGMDALMLDPDARPILAKSGLLPSGS